MNLKRKQVYKMNNFDDRIKKIEDKILCTPKFIEKMEEIFLNSSYEKLTSEDIDKLKNLMPDKYKILIDELTKQMEERI